MPKVVTQALLVTIVLTAPQVCLAQANDYAILHSIGRFWGVGYTKGGYHAANDGRPAMVTRHHPPSAYASQSLQYVYSPEYRPAMDGKSNPQRFERNSLDEDNSSAALPDPKPVKILPPNDASPSDQLLNDELEEIDLLDTETTPRLDGSLGLHTAHPIFNVQSKAAYMPTSTMPGKQVNRYK